MNTWLFFICAFCHYGTWILYYVHDFRWSQIAAHLPGRTDNEIKNFWNTHVRKKLVNSGIDPKTHEPIIINHLNNFLANYSHLLSTSNLTNLVITNPLDSALASLRSLLPQPAPNIQLLQNLWQIINSTKPLPCAIQENGLLQSSYTSQCNGLSNGTNAPYNQDSFTFPNTHIPPPRLGEDFAISNSSAFHMKGRSMPEVFHNDAIRSNYQKETMLPLLVSATDNESFGVKPKNQTSFPTEPPAASDWEDLLHDEDGCNSFWKDLIKDL